MLLEVIVLFASDHQQVFSLKKKSLMIDQAKNIKQSQTSHDNHAWFIKSY